VTSWRAVRADPHNRFIPPMNDSICHLFP